MSRSVTSHPETPSREQRTPSVPGRRTAWLGLLVPCGLLGLLAVVMHTSDELCRSTFGRSDLFWTVIASSLPLALWWGLKAQGRLTTVMAGLPAVLAGLAWLLLLQDASASIGEGSPLRRFDLALLGTVAAMCAVSVGSLSRSVKGRWPEFERYRGGVSAALLALLVPWSYAASVADATGEKLSESLQSQRVLLARDQARTLAAIAPAEQIHGKTPPELVPLLDEAIHHLQTQLASPLPRTAGIAEIGGRVVALISMERHTDALELLEPLTKRPETGGIAFDYCGLCCQRLGLWKQSRDWYRKSRDAWSKHPENQSRTDALLSAYKGIAFAERRLDHPAAAEQAYQEALAVSPTAEIHFLLAIHYEEQQQTRRAADHARKAISLAPHEYRDPGRQLLDRMALSHFGCMQVGPQSGE